MRYKLPALVVASLLALSACGSSSSGAAGAGSTEFRVAYLPTANYLTTVKESGYLEEEGKKVGTTVKWIGPLDPVTAYDTVTAGEADVSSTGTGYFVNLAGTGDDWMAFALEKYSGKSQGIVANEQSGVTDLKGLYGKKVGIDSPGGTGDYLLNLAFKEAGLDVGKVEKVTLDTSTFATAFASGQVDAIASYDQNLAAAMATEGSKVLITGADMNSYNWSIHIVSREWAEAHPKELKAMYDGLVREAARAKADPSVITDTYKEFGATDELVQQIATFDVPTIEPMDSTVVADLEKLGQQYVDFGFLKSVPDIKTAVVDES
ncbi:NrtA/SsuA/CpmA family ABC transporter substrate-binding protein [Kineosporia mesophila]|uniref:NrtA/SsuA/CpmA family ABC transporter substrate-binding protein n=1 Tax=Kineosporia mesophila TaxID=566012 RepID=A0ABP7ATL9_9ACTN|nr:NrtA/SsuA/CpmA family ABC transporter substrate-binding protein [Kineosporia mesophila]MCD5352368.1 NrtA/SsuA/CpmA family ABC transporter substrate-binding protein [Kineosporia mesophila]